MVSVARIRSRVKRIAPPTEGPFNLRIGIGQEPGYLLLSDLHDPKSIPWPIDDGVVDTIFAAFWFHRLSQAERFAFMDECWRVLKQGNPPPSGQLIMIMPHGRSDRQAGDPLAQWPPVIEASFSFYDRAWREREQMTDLSLTCNFSAGLGHIEHPYLTGRNDEFKAHEKEHAFNAVLDLHATLTKQP